MPLCLQVSALAVSVIYYAWRDGYVAQLRRQRVLRERVAYMLWTTAQHCG